MIYDAEAVRGFTEIDLLAAVSRVRGLRLTLSPDNALQGPLDQDDAVLAGELRRRAEPPAQETRA